MHWGIKWSPAKTNRILPRECTGNSKHLLPTTQETALTWTSPDGQYQNQIDYSLCSQRWRWSISSFQLSSVAQWCLTLCDSMDGSTPGLPVHHQLPESTQTHVHWVGDAIQPSHPLSSPSPPTFTLSQCQCLFQWVSSSYQVAKVLEFQLQHQSFQWTLRTDFL